MGRLISTEEYAKLQGKSARVIRQKIAAGTLKATMIGGRYAIDEDEPYIDARIKTGDYIGHRHGYEYQKKSRKRAAARRAEQIAAETKSK